jgi:O-antigen ligase
MDNLKKLLKVFTFLTLILGTLLWSNTFSYGYVNAKAFALLIGFTLIISCGLILVRGERIKIALRNPLVLGILVFLSIHIFGTISSHDPTLSLYGDPDRATGTLLLLVLGLGAVVLGLTLTKEEARKYILLPLLFGGLLGALSVWIEIFGFKPLASAAGAGVFGNSSIAGTYLFASLFVTLYLLCTSSRRSHKILFLISGIIIVLNPIFINVTFLRNHTNLIISNETARAATASLLYGLVVASAVYLALQSRKLWKKIGYAILFVIGSSTLVAMVLLANPTSKVHDWFAHHATGSRFIYWNIAWKGFQDRPVLGTGPETYGYTFQTYFNPEMMLKENASEIWSNKPHNAYLEILSTLGILGALGYLFLISGFSLASLRERRRDKLVPVFFIGFLGAYLLNNIAFFDTPTSLLALYGIFAFVISATLPPLGIDDHRRTRASAYLWVRTMGALVLISLMGIIIVGEMRKTYAGSREFTLPLEARAKAYDQTESMSPYGSAVFLAKRADFTYQSVYLPNVPMISEQSPENRAIAVKAIDALVASLYSSFTKYPENEEGWLSIGRLESVKVAINNKADPDTFKDMEHAGERAIALSPTNPQGYWLLGQAYVYEKAYGKAEAQFEKAYMLDPRVAESHMALINLAMLEADQKKFDMYIKRAYKESPGFQYNHFTIGK